MSVAHRGADIGTRTLKRASGELLRVRHAIPFVRTVIPIFFFFGGCGVSRGSLLDARLAANVTVGAIPSGPRPAPARPPPPREHPRGAQYYVVVEGAVYGAAAQDPLGALLGRLHSATHVGRFGLSVTDESCPPEPADLCAALPGADECGLGLLAGAVPPFASAAFAGASFALGLGAGAGADADPLALARPSLLYRVPAAPWARNLSVNGCTPPPTPGSSPSPRAAPRARPPPAPRPQRSAPPRPAAPAPLASYRGGGALRRPRLPGRPFGLTVTSSRDFCERPTLLTLLGTSSRAPSSDSPPLPARARPRALQTPSPPSFRSLAAPSPTPAPTGAPPPAPTGARRPPHRRPAARPHRRPAARPHWRPSARPHRRRLSAMTNLSVRYSFEVHESEPLVDGSGYGFATLAVTLACPARRALRVPVNCSVSIYI
eukprot:tig00020685_g12951.t1